MVDLAARAVILLIQANVLDFMFDSFACGPEEWRGRFSRTTGASEPGYNRGGGNAVLMWENCQEKNRESSWITT